MYANDAASPTCVEQNRIRAHPHRILAAARKVFARQGVTRTTFEEIAARPALRAGRSTGIFADKTELFFAMREQVAVPMIDQIDLALLRRRRVRSSCRVERFLRGISGSLEGDRLHADVPDNGLSSANT